MSGHSSPEEIKKHVKVYITVFATLLFLTVLTVAVSYIHLPVHQAILVALAIACTKASLVGLFFMHLANEKKVIYRTLAVTALLFVFLMSISLYI